MENTNEDIGESMTDNKEGETGISITKEDIILKYKDLHKVEPTWTNKKMSEMSQEESNEYKNYRKKVARDRSELSKEDRKAKDAIREAIEINELDEPNNADESFYDADDNKLNNDEKNKGILHTANKAYKDIVENQLSPEDQEKLDKQLREDEFISKYFKQHSIEDQARLNYVIEHDEKFRTWLEKVGRLDSFYTGKHLGEIAKEKERVDEELTKEAKKDKSKRLVKKFDKKKKPKQTNEFKDSKKLLNLEPYRNKKLEKQGFILCIYLRKNGLAELKYVKMDEVGQIKVDGYVYHETDATYRFGKKNDPVLIIMEGALVPLSREMLKENLGEKTAKAQKLCIQGIEQAEVVKTGDLQDSKKNKAPPKWIIVVVIGIIIGIYAYMGGFS